MDERSAPGSTALGITAVERDTGIPKETLRAWERRYGFPSPARDRHGERCYPLAQVARLRLLRRLVDAGHRPGRVVRLDDLALERLVRCIGAGDVAARQAEGAVPDGGDAADTLALLVTHARACRGEFMAGRLDDWLARLGLARFVCERLAPLVARLGAEWAAGSLEIHAEHYCTELIQNVLRRAIGAHRPCGAEPRVVLATFPGEPHGIGLLMAEAMLAWHGARCRSLGVQVPIAEIVRARVVHDADVVALSFSAGYGGQAGVEELRALRAALPAQTQVWTGGACAALTRHAPAGVRHLGRLEAIGAAVADWRRAASDTGS